MVGSNATLVAAGPFAVAAAVAAVVVVDSSLAID